MGLAETGGRPGEPEIWEETHLADVHAELAREAAGSPRGGGPPPDPPPRQEDAAKGEG